MNFYVYILASAPAGYLYVGHTENLERRMAEHRSHGLAKAYTARHDIHQLVYFEEYTTRDEAKRRESILKKMPRTKKFKLVETDNPKWLNLAAAWS